VDEQAQGNLQARTDAKLRYAQVHLEELRAIEALRGDDFERAHLESFLYHMLGAKDAFLAEINHCYDARLSAGAGAGDIRTALLKRGLRSDELTTLYKLEQDPASWLSQAKVMRDHSTHKTGVSRTYSWGGDDHGQVKLRNTTTGGLGERHYVDQLGEWLEQMRSLISTLRESALRHKAARS
jgi:hypothetical protein